MSNNGYITTARAKAMAEQEALRQQRAKEILALQAAQRAANPTVEQQPIPATPTSKRGEPVASSRPQPVISPEQLSIEDLQKELYRRKEELNKKVADMKLDADAYRLNIPSIKLMTEDKNKEERLKFIGNIAIATEVPIIIVCVYLGEIYGFDSGLDEALASLMKFYTVTEVLNVKRVV